MIEWKKATHNPHIQSGNTTNIYSFTKPIRALMNAKQINHQLSIIVKVGVKFMTNSSGKKNDPEQEMMIPPPRCKEVQSDRSATNHEVHESCVIVRLHT